MTGKQMQVVVSCKGKKSVFVLCVGFYSFCVCVCVFFFLFPNFFDQTSFVLTERLGTSPA